MKIFLMLLTFFSTLHAYKTQKKVHIGKHTFNLVEESYNEYGDKGITMALYVVESNTTSSPKLSFILNNESGSCSDKNVENGTYEIKEDTITFYTHWKRSRNSDNRPIGNRIQIYKVDENGSFYMSNSRTYIEQTTQYPDADEGMQYLFTEAKTETEKQLLHEYIISVESLYKAKFVRGDEADNLAFEVNAALLKKQKQHWK
jgi:hypothetical protein